MAEKRQLYNFRQETAARRHAQSPSTERDCEKKGEQEQELEQEQEERQSQSYSEMFATLRLVIRW